jgi:hypothetical protein
MAWDIGDAPPIELTVEDNAGTPVDATVVLTVTAPDGTTVATAINHTGVGAYSAAPVTTMAGRWQYRWEISGAATGVDLGFFDVAVDPPARLESLASTTDLEDALGRDLTAAEATRARGLLAAASAQIRRYTGQTFTYVPNDTLVTRPDGDQIRLPQRPAIAVASVVGVGTGGLPNVPLVGWWWDGLETVYLGGIGIQINLPEWWLNECVGYTFRITYSHGYAEVPADVVGVAVGMVLRTLTAPTQSGGVTSETIGSYSYRIDSAGIGLQVRLTADDKSSLADYRSKGFGTVRMSNR